MCWLVGDSSNVYHIYINWWRARCGNSFHGSVLVQYSSVSDEYASNDDQLSRYGKHLLVVTDPNLFSIEKLYSWSNYLNLYLVAHHSTFLQNSSQKATTEDQLHVG